VECIGVPDEFVEHGKQSDLRTGLSLDAAGIAARAQAAFPGLAAVPAGR
jgi:deoxyxylulose-5-phosphate synthase